MPPVALLVLLALVFIAVAAVMLRQARRPAPASSDPGAPSAPTQQPVVPEQPSPQPVPEQPSPPAVDPLAEWLAVYQEMAAPKDREWKPTPFAGEPWAVLSDHTFYQNYGLYIPGDLGLRRDVPMEQNMTACAAHCLADPSCGVALATAFDNIHRCEKYRPPARGQRRPTFTYRSAGGNVATMVPLARYRSLRPAS